MTQPLKVLNAIWNHQEAGVMAATNTEIRMSTVCIVDRTLVVC